MPISAPTQVAILDQRLSAEALAIGLSSRNEIEVLWAVDSQREADRRLQTDRPQVLLVDFAIGISVHEFLQKLSQNCPELCIVLLTMDGDAQILGQSHELNVAGCVRKTEPLRKLEQAIHHIASGRFSVSEDAHCELGAAKNATWIICSEAQPSHSV